MEQQMEGNNSGRRLSGVAGGAGEPHSHRSHFDLSALSCPSRHFLEILRYSRMTQGFLFQCYHNISRFGWRTEPDFARFLAQVFKPIWLCFYKSRLLNFPKESKPQSSWKFSISHHDKIINVFMFRIFFFTNFFLKLYTVFSLLNRNEIGVTII